MKSKHQIKKSQILAVVFVLLLIVAFFGVRAYNVHKQREFLRQNLLTYNGFKFQRSAGMWWTEWVNGKNEYTIPFRFSPPETENVTISGKLKGYAFRPLYITFNPQDRGLQYVALAASELSISLAKVFSIRPISACSKPVERVCPPKPIVTCNSTNESVIFFRVSNQTAIKLNKNCIIFQGQGFELVRAVDRFLYFMYGIM